MIKYEIKACGYIANDGGFTSIGWMPTKHWETVLTLESKHDGACIASYIKEIAENLALVYRVPMQIVWHRDNKQIGKLEFNLMDANSAIRRRSNVTT